ncbi:KAT1 transaminase, partial [Amia calva]|nr:KAT1 transaminase [Amia calva]
MSRKLHARRVEGITTALWVKIFKLAADYKAVDLSLGYPDYCPPDIVREALGQAVSGDWSQHQYTHAFGHPALVKVLAQFFQGSLGQEIDPQDNILVTVGAYQALHYTFQALVDEGDEVIIIDPSCGWYESMVKMAGGRAVFVPLRPKAGPEGLQSSSHWALDPEELAGKFTQRTKAIVLNTPNNPLGKVFKREELQVIADLCVKHGVVCVSDEVCEGLMYDRAQHVKIASLPGMWERTVTIGSAGKTFSATGLKVGWAIGPESILKHVKSVHVVSVYNCPTTPQEAVARLFQRELENYGKPESYILQLPQTLNGKRKKLADSLVSVGMQPIMPEGGYFMIADFSTIGVDLQDPHNTDEPYDYRFVKWMIRNKGLATIPMSAFYSPEHQKDFENYVRFCFVKEDSTLRAAEKILREWSVKK